MTDYTLIPPPAFDCDWTSNRTDQWLTVPEIKALVGKRVNYLEVGVFEGRTFVWVLEHILTHAGARAHAVDLFEDNKHFGAHIAGYFPRFMHHTEPYREKRYVHRGWTGDILPLLPPHEFDLIYIDAAHDEPYVGQDCREAFPLLKERGVMVFDDYGNGETTPGVDAFLETVEGQYKELKRGYQLFIQRTE